MGVQPTTSKMKTPAQTSFGTSFGGTVGIKQEEFDDERANKVKVVPEGRGRSEAERRKIKSQKFKDRRIEEKREERRKRNKVLQSRIVNRDNLDEMKKQANFSEQSGGSKPGPSRKGGENIPPGGSGKSNKGKVKDPLDQSKTGKLRRKEQRLVGIQQREIDKINDKIAKGMRDNGRDKFENSKKGKKLISGKANLRVKILRIRNTIKGEIELIENSKNDDKKRKKGKNVIR